MHLPILRQFAKVIIFVFSHWDRTVCLLIKVPRKIILTHDNFCISQWDGELLLQLINVKIEVSLACCGRDVFFVTSISSATVITLIQPILQDARRPKEYF